MMKNKGKKGKRGKGKGGVGYFSRKCSKIGTC